MRAPAPSPTPNETGPLLTTQHALAQIDATRTLRRPLRYGLFRYYGESRGIRPESIVSGVAHWSLASVERIGDIALALDVAKQTTTKPSAGPN